MNILAIDRSTDTQSVALAIDGKVHAKVFAGLDSRASDWPVKIREFLAAYGVGVRDLGQVLVGQGPGSFAGIRAALAFAQGIALGNPSCTVVGLPSTYALTRDGARTAVVGDARRDRYWVAIYDGVKAVGDFALVGKFLTRFDKLRCCHGRSFRVTLFKVYSSFYMCSFYSLVRDLEGHLVAAHYHIVTFDALEHPGEVRAPVNW